MKLYTIPILFLISLFTSAQVTLDPCIENTAFTIVVLGSSTAAGTGPSHPDSTWVNKYRKSLQAINPNNQVINLAVGGFTTYRVMPDSFATPSGRPSVDFQHNIDKALTYNPDAIIVNLPSNDRNWPREEQLNNFDTLYNYSLNNGVPMFICTTQPILPLSSATYQREVADSILLNFGINAIDVFAPLAAPNNTVDTTYAADAVHLNDKGHVILHQAVIQTDILFKIYTPQLGIDLAVQSIINASPYCTDSIALISVITANLGDTVFGGNLINVDVNGNLYTLNTTNTILPCACDTLTQTVNLSKDTLYTLLATVSLSTDINPLNDSLEEKYNLIQSPRITAYADTGCISENISFNAQLIYGDTVLYYTNPNDSIPVSTSSFSLNKDTTIYAQGVTGKLTYNNTLKTQDIGNIDFNGNMFDLVPTASITLNEIGIIPKNTGLVPVTVYIRNGSYKGFEQNSAGWTLWTQDTLNVIIAGTWTNVNMQSLGMLANDTLGVYIHMTQSGQSLNYQSLAQPLIKNTSELQFISGVGIGYSFGTIYFPRAISAEFFYDYGVNYLGTCHTPLKPVSYSLSREQLQIVHVANIPLEGDTVYANTGFVNYVWTNLNTGDTLSNLNYAFIDSNQIINGNTTLTIACAATDKWGCQKSDTSTTTIQGHISIDENNALQLRLYPNPASTQLTLENPTRTILKVSIYNTVGQRVYINQTEHNSIQIDCSHLSEGQYVVHLQSLNSTQVEKIIIAKN